MAEEHNHQQNNPAFIADLLEKLRRQMAGEDQTDTAEAPPTEDVTSITDVTDDTTVVVAPAEVAEEVSPVVPPRPETTPADAAELDPVQDEVVPDEAQDDFVVSSEDSISASRTEEDLFDEATPGQSPADDTVILPMYTDGVTAEDEIAEPQIVDLTPPAMTPATEASDEIVDSVVGDQYSMFFPEALYEGERQISSGHATEITRHPVNDELYDIVDFGVTADPEQYAMQLDAIAPDMPVPDEDVVIPVASIVPQTPPVSPEEETVETPHEESYEESHEELVSVASEEPEEEVLIPTAETPFTVIEATSEDITEEQPSYHATRRAKRETYADVDFDAVRDSDVLCEKVLTEPLESIGGEHAEAQIEKWQTELTRRRRSLRTRSIIVGVIVALLALFELIRPATDWVLGALLITRVPLATALIDIQLLILVCIIGYRPLYRGFAALRFRRVIPETLASFAAAACLLGGVIFYMAGVTDQYLFALTGGITVLIAVVSDFFRAESLLHTFRACTAAEKLYGGVLSAAHEHRLIRELYRDGTDPILMETEPTSRVDGYVAAARERVEGRRASLVSLCIAGGVALIDLVVLLILRRGVAFSFWSALVTFAAVMPLSLFAVHRYLARMLTSRIALERIGVTGERAVYRYAECGVMSFSDTEAFPNGSVQVKGIKLCGDFRLDKALYLVSSLFDRVGGPLNSVFRISTADVRISDDVEIRVLAPEGIRAQINHEEVCVGTRAYLEGIGVEIFRDIEDERAEQDGNRVLYVAYRGILCTKFYVKYEISPSFEKNVEYYAKHGVSSVILTADPLMNDALLDSISYISDYDVRFVKRDLSSLQEERNIPREVELVSYGPRKTLRRMPFFFKKYVRLQRLATVLSMVGLGVCVAAVPLLLAAVPVRTALFAFLFQLLALTPAAIVGIVVRRMNPNP